MPSEETLNTLIANLLPQTSPGGFTRMADVDSSSMAAKAVPIVLEALDKTTVEILTQLDDLIESIQAVKTAIISNTERMKLQNKLHFEFGAEAIGFAELVRNRLGEVVGQNGPVAGANGHKS